MMKRFVPYILMLILTMVLVVTLGSSVLRKQHIFPVREGRDINQLVITMHDNPNRRSYGNELRVKSISVNGESLDLGKYSSESWVWHPEWGYVLYQQGDNTFTVDINQYVENLTLTLIKQEGSGKCTVSFNGMAEKSYDMYSSNWHETVYSVKYVNDFYLAYLKLSVGIVLFVLLVALYRIVLYVLGKQPVTPAKIGLGAFDFAKGLGLILVILGHSAQEVSSENAYISYGIFTAIVAITMMYTALPMFAIVSGYGSKAADPLVTIKKQMKVLLEFYGMFALIVILIDIIKLLLLPGFESQDFIRQIVAICTLMQHDYAFRGLQIGNIGPMWFLVSLCIARVVLNGVLRIKNKKLQVLAVALMLIPFYFATKLDLAMLCLAPVFSIVLFLYVGHCLSKYKIFKNENKITRIVFIIGTLVFYATAAMNGTFITIAGNNWGNNMFVGLLMATLGGTVLTWLCLQYGNTVFRRFNAVRKIGRLSLFFFLAHSIEYMTIPWGKIIQQLNAGFYVKSITVFLCRMIVVSLLTWILMRVYGRLHRKKQRN